MLTGDTPKTAMEDYQVDSTEQLISRSELARRIHLHERTVDRMVRRGELPDPCLSAGGRPRWLWSFVVKHLQDRHVEAVQLRGRVQSKLN